MVKGGRGMCVGMWEWYLEFTYTNKWKKVLTRGERHRPVEEGRTVWVKFIVEQELSKRLGGLS